ncbi:MAG: cell division protein FtsL, partial [Spirochaetaceae bacterium]|nr:cell division protein FtsL [Spirochaetaceae bacterium]
FARAEKEIKALEAKQRELVESNKRMVTGISILANPERIEFLAVETLGMRQADSDEIVRVQVKESEIAKQ